MSHINNLCSSYIYHLTRFYSCVSILFFNLVINLVLYKVLLIRHYQNLVLS